MNYYVNTWDGDTFFVTTAPDGENFAATFNGITRASDTPERAVTRLASHCGWGVKAVLAASPVQCFKERHGAGRGPAWLRRVRRRRRTGRTAQPRPRHDRAGRRLIDPFTQLIRSRDAALAVSRRYDAMLAALDRVYASIVDLPLPWQAADVVLGEDGVVHLAWSIVAGKVRLRVHPDPSLHVWTYECVGTPRQEFIQESPPETWCAFVKKEFT